MAYIDSTNVKGTPYDIHDTAGRNMIAPAYSTASAYAVGDYVVYNDKLYRCAVAIASGEAWTAAHWTAVDVGGEVGDLKSQMDSISNLNLFMMAGATNGYTIRADGSIVSTSFGLYSALIPVKAGNKYHLSLTYGVASSGWYIRVHGYTGPLVEDWDSQLAAISCAYSGGSVSEDIDIASNSSVVGLRISIYHADVVSNVIFTEYVDGNSDVTAIDVVARNALSSVKNEIDEIADIRYPTISNKSDSSYIKTDGSIASNSSYFYSNAIPVNAGDLVDYYGKGYNQNVSMISMCDSNVENIVPKVVSVDSAIQHYYYTVLQNGYITISGSKSAEYLLKIYGSTSAIAIRNELDKKQTIPFSSFSMFRTFGVIGDSYASGYIDFTPASGDAHVDYAISWGQILARLAGNTCYNFSRGGLSTKTWLTDATGKAALENESPLKLYIVCLGINDYLSADYGLGTASDIGTAADSFYGYYSNIIDVIKAHAPNAKIVLSTMRSGRTGGNASFTADQVNEAIVVIADSYGLPCVMPDDDPLFTSELYLDQKSQGHPVAVIYSGMAEAYKRLIEKIMVDDLTYFYDYVDDE